MNVILYSTNCPRCRVLETKLEQKGIDYHVVDDVDKMIDLGMTQVPELEVDGVRMNFSEAVKWVNEK